MTKSKPPEPPKSDRVDPLLEKLLARAQPIIAEERGLNQRSRVKIQALGKQMKVPAGVIDQALQLLHGAPPVHGSGESQYEKSYARAMRKKIDGIPGRILTTRIEDRAVSIGTRKYQLSDVQARNIVRRIAEEVGVPRVSLTEAERHIEQEIAEVIGESTWVSGEKKKRLIRNGKRLGVTQQQTESMIQRHLQFNFQQSQFEKKLTERLWIVAGCIMAGTLLALFLFFQFKKAASEQEAWEKIEEEKRKDPPAGDTVPGIVAAPAWWDDSLKLLLQKTRLKVPGFATVHDRMKDTSPVKRGEAYRDLLDLDRDQVNPHVTRQRIDAVIPGLFASEPDQSAWQPLASGLVGTLKFPGGKLPESVDHFHKAFWSLAVLNRIVGMEDLGDAKINQVQSLVEDACGRGFDLFLPEEPRLEKERRALFESWFNNLTDIGPAHPDRSPGVFEDLKGLAGDDLTPDRLQEFRWRFLVEFLRFEESNWSHASSLIADAINESSPAQAAFFVDLMESTSIDPLQRFLEGRLGARIAVVGEDLEVAELATRMREKLGIDSASSPESATSIRDGIDPVLVAYANKWLLSPPRLDNRQQAQLMLDSVYVSTLVGMADPGNRDELERLISTGFPDLNDHDYLKALKGESPSETETDSRPLMDSPAGAEQRFARQNLDTALDQLNHFKIVSIPKRLNALRLVQRNAERIQRLTGKQASVLAEYLLSRKNSGEEQQVLELVPAFRRWPRLPIAMADLLRTGTFPRQTCLDVASVLLDQDLNFTGSGWPVRLADHLTQHGIAQIRTNAERGTSRTRNDPIHQLKNILCYFYRIRAVGMGADIHLVPQDDLDGLMTAILRARKAELETSRQTEVLNRFDQQLEIIESLGTDPLSRFALQQQALLLTLEESGASSPPMPPSEATMKLENLLKNRLAISDTVAGQIAENEIRILLVVYRHKLK